MNKILEVFGSKVFNDAVMREKLPKEIYKLFLYNLFHRYTFV